MTGVGTRAAADPPPVVASRSGMVTAVTINAATMTLSQGRLIARSTRKSAPAANATGIEQLKRDRQPGLLGVHDEEDQQSDDDRAGSCPPQADLSRGPPAQLVRNVRVPRLAAIHAAAQAHSAAPAELAARSIMSVLKRGRYPATTSTGSLSGPMRSNSASIQPTRIRRPTDLSHR